MRILFQFFHFYYSIFFLYAAQEWTTDLNLHLVSIVTASRI